ncbi:HAD family hydrolase [uncultured Dysosmobacter sp.]|uniref:HAD family hydrolase n=1 Tax=uncultured Dysosmobacter sp. TaxID=2591384 RepID=UPI00261F4E7F|nr:HAD-IA family hydrolase [uncultured Dysosmobacter sp.]
MKKHYNAVLFDLDGTLLDTTEGVVAAVRKTILDNDFPMPDAVVLKSFVGPPMQKTMGEVFNLDKEIALRVANEFRENYKSSLFQAKLYDGVSGLLQNLQKSGWKIAVATNKSHQNAMNVLERFGILQYCDFAQGSDLAGKLSKKDIIEKCIRALDCNKKDVVLIGDSIFDLQGAEQAEVDFVAVTYGFGFIPGDEISSKRCVFVADDTVELMQWLTA